MSTNTDHPSLLRQAAAPRSPAHVERDISELERLANSAGWRLLVEEIDRGVLAAAMEMGDSAVMAEAEMHFRRGAIRAAADLKRLPLTLAQRLATELALASAVADMAQGDNPPTQP